MPIYEYKCKKCNNKFEKLVWEKEQIKCPNCDSTSVKKLMSGFNVGQSKNSSSGSSGCETGTCPITRT